MRRRIFENVFQDDEFLDRKEELFNFLYSIGMDSNSDEAYADLNKDGENDTLMTHFNMGAVTVYVGLCNFSNGEFKYLLYIKSSEGIVLKPTFFDSVAEIEQNVSPYIETAYDDTKLSYLGIENEKEYMPSKSEYNDMLNSAIDSQDWEEARRIQDKYGKLYESRKKIIRLTESDLSRIVKRVLSESDNCEEDYKNFECPKGTIRGESVGYTNVCSTAQIIAQNNWMKSKGLSSYNFSNIAIVDSIQCNGKCIACINEPGTKVKPEKIRMKDLKESFQSKSDLSRIVKKVINEQWWFEVLNNSWGPDIPMGDVNLTRTLSEKERFKMLFDWAKTWPSTGSDWNSIKSYAVNMKNEMSGMGSGNVLNYLRKINTKAKFAALCKNFNYDGSNLYDWFSGEQTIGWGDIMDIIPIEIKTGVPKKAVNSAPLYN